MYGTKRLYLICFPLSRFRPEPAETEGVTAILVRFFARAVLARVYGGGTAPFRIASKLRLGDFQYDGTQFVLRFADRLAASHLMKSIIYD